MFKMTLFFLLIIVPYFHIFITPGLNDLGTCFQSLQSLPEKFCFISKWGPFKIGVALGLSKGTLFCFRHFPDPCKSISFKKKRFSALISIFIYQIFFVLDYRPAFAWKFFLASEAYNHAWNNSLFETIRALEGFFRYFSALVGTCAYVR